MYKVLLILQYFLAAFVIIPTAGKTCLHEFVSSLRPGEDPLNNNNGEIAVVDALNEYYNCNAEG